MGNDPFEGTGFVACNVRNDTDCSAKGAFDFPNNAVDLIGLFLDPDIRAARDKVHAQIESNTVQGGGIVNGGGLGITQNNGGVTQAAARLQKAVVSIHALNKQANRNMANQR